MKVYYSDSEKGILSKIEANGVCVPFYEGSGPSFYYRENGASKAIALCKDDGIYAAEFEGIRFSMEHVVSEDRLTLKACIHNRTKQDFMPEVIGLKLGISSYMTEYPQWNDQFFPSYLRCEKTHLVGYFMSPLGKLVAIICETPVAAWELDYNMAGDAGDEDCDFGHRIYTGNLLLTVNGTLPERHPQNLNGIKAQQELSWLIHIVPLEQEAMFPQTVVEDFHIPMIEFQSYTLAKGETARLTVSSWEPYDIRVVSPSGQIIQAESFVANEYGVYKATVTTDGGKICQATVYCRHDYGWYLKAAAKNAIYKPQKASTHTESWYGHFSSFLAHKHDPDMKLYQLAKANFDEIMPYMFNFEQGKPIIIPSRIQNTAALISLLTDLYEADPVHNEQYLDYADQMAEDLMSRQTPDGAYRKEDHHYTSVIYIAKSMLELSLCEKQLGSRSAKYMARYERHYASAKRAVYDLVKLRERIGTEGEHTLEDGMITCSALQIAYFALTLEETEREPFIEAAEYLMSIHRCLEDRCSPDCRTRGATLRFWEAQYDVLIRGNMLNAPHGWTSWKNYATYYLYLLTGKEAYLQDTINTMGACLQMIDENENLRWAFIKDPYIKAKVWVPDEAKPVTDGYESVPEDIQPAYRGKFEVQTFGETYIDMISGWYRVGEQKITGGYRSCPLIYEDGNIEVDNQGGACDNDVHEHFKCLEETLLKKAFVIIDEKARGYNCCVEKEGQCFCVTPFEECAYLHVNTQQAASIKVNGRVIQVNKGMSMIRL